MISLPSIAQQIAEKIRKQEELQTINQKIREKKSELDDIIQLLKQEKKNAINNNNNNNNNIEVTNINIINNGMFNTIGNKIKTDKLRNLFENKYKKLR
jgi:hypothetical protein